MNGSCPPRRPATDTAPDEAAIPFEPAVFDRYRNDGWTPERQRAFIAALALIGLVSAAARTVGMSAKSAYVLRRRAGAGSFAAAWDVAIGHGRDRARDTAIERALNGEVVPIFYRGRQVGERRRFNDRLVVVALRTTIGVRSGEA